MGIALGQYKVFLNKSTIPKKSQSQILLLSAFYVTAGNEAQKIVYFDKSALRPLDKLPPRV